jgi:hypothetical protein
LNARRNCHEWLAIATGVFFQMPAGVVRTERDEAAWERAKEIVARQGRGVKDRWALVMHIFQNIAGKKGGESEKSLDFDVFWKQSAFTGLPGSAGKGAKRPFDESKVRRVKGRFAPKGGAKEGGDSKPEKEAHPGVGVSRQLHEAGVPHVIHPDGRIEVQPKPTAAEKPKPKEIPFDIERREPPEPPARVRRASEATAPRGKAAEPRSALAAAWRAAQQAYVRHFAEQLGMT